MALSYSTLVTAIQDYSENTFTTFDINLIITKTEQFINNAVQLLSFRKNAPVNTTANSQYLILPVDFISMFSINLVDANGNAVYLVNKDVEFIRQAYPMAIYTGIPKYYALYAPGTGTQFLQYQIILGPTPDKVYNGELDYFGYPESITTAASGTTWLSQNFDYVLLDGCLYEAAIYMQQEQDILGNLKTKFQEGLAQLKQVADGKQRMDTFRTVQTRNPVQ